MTDIVERLREWAAAGAALREEQELDAIMYEAADVIEALRSLGKAAVGPSFAEVAKDLRHEAPGVMDDA